MTKTLAVFDFDGTLTFRDSMIDFLWRTFGKRRFCWEFIKLFPVLLGYKLKLIANHDAKQRLLGAFFKNMPVSDFTEMTQQYSRLNVESILREDAFSRLQWHIEQGHVVLIITASVEDWVAPFFAKMSIEVLGTQLEFKHNKLTGSFSTPNCYGKEKVVRLKSWMGNHRFDEVYAYGDSAGDKELLAFANKPNYRIFKSQGISKC